ncbi:hypothetical protein ASF72_10770 [Arthrobacter sp. Leaf141]|uniref:hypothetical protein n=1 Tax=Arthrobacter sp. Leaf141 TaxID=1736273 RepID=UPI00070064DC|nr:hypothetical protein [Arthrobacter sp. Leaf141]KQR02508.1 hypothetical protein ASF72_10770 [Arthrobacter sp. Leaf141]
MKARIKRLAVVHPVHGAPFKDRAIVQYRDNKELVEQLKTYCRSKWPLPQTIQVDVHAAHILIDGSHTASYSLVEPRP